MFGRQEGRWIESFQAGKVIEMIYSRSQRVRHTGQMAEVRELDGWADTKER